MSLVYLSPNQIAGFFSERLGIKSGLALSRHEIVDHLDRGRIADVVAKENDIPTPINVFDATKSFQLVLYRLGVIDKPEVEQALIAISNKYGGNYNVFSTATRISGLLDQEYPEVAIRGLGRSFPDVEFLGIVKDRLGASAVTIATEYLASQRYSDLANPWQWADSSSREWKNLVNLNELFCSEAVGGEGGKFLDQRFIDYLGANFDRIDDIHWRKFEALTAEYFQRDGFQVVLGPGRNDGGIDVRAWKDCDGGTRITLLAQCKRQKSSVGKVVVKALYADILEHDATSGLIVTTSRLEPGADQVRIQREYPIEVADRAKLRQWINELKTPGRGAFLST